MRNMNPPNNLVDQIHYDIAHGRIEGPEILLTAEQLAECSGDPHVKDGQRLLGKVVRLTDGEPNVVYTPEVPNESWIVGGFGRGVGII